MYIMLHDQYAFEIVHYSKLFMDNIFWCNAGKKQKWTERVLGLLKGLSFTEAENK